MKILIIEDDNLIARMYHQAFVAEGFTVEIATGGQEGLTKARSMKPDLVLLDIMMPKMNGMQVLSALKADANLKSIPVVMLTNLSGAHDAEAAKAKGALDYLVKSEYKPREVIAKVKHYVGGK